MTDAADSAEWRKLGSSWVDRFREEGAGAPTQQPAPKGSILVTYRVLNDGAAFHTQDMGWRMTADILFEQIVARQKPRAGCSAEETRTHAEFDSLATRQMSYVYLACWRLSIEIDLKQALRTVHESTRSLIPNKLDRLLSGHDIGGLWARLIGILPVLESAINETATEHDIDATGPGFSLDSIGYRSTIGLLVSIDPDGQSLRYRQSLKGEINMGSIMQVDVADAQVRFTNLCWYLQRISRLATAVQQIREIREIALGIESGVDGV